MPKGPLRIGLVVLLLVGMTVPGLAEEKEGPTTLAGVFARHGSKMVTDAWLEALADMHIVFGEEPAFAAHKKATQEAMEQFKKKAYYDAAISFGLVFRSVLANPTGSEADSVYAALLFRARDVSLSEAEDICTKSVPKNPMTPGTFDEAYLIDPPDKATAKDQFKLFCTLSVGFTYLAVHAEDFTDQFPKKDQDDRLSQLLFRMALAEERAHGDEFDVVRLLEDAVKKVGRIELPGTQRDLKAKALALVERYQERVELAIAGYTLVANVAWYAAQMAQQQGQAAAQADGINRAYNAAVTGAIIEETYVALRHAFEKPTGRSIDIHRLTATLGQLELQQNLTLMHTLGRQHRDALVAAAGAQVALTRALQSLATIVQHDAADWVSRLSLAELIIMKEGKDLGAGPTVAGEAATAVEQLVGQALSAGANSPDAYYRAGRLLLSARLPGAKAPLEKFLQLAPTDPRAGEVKTWLDGLGGK